MDDKEEMVHSACPKKADIRTPVMALFEYLRMGGGTVECYRCEACGTVVMLKKPAATSTKEYMDAVRYDAERMGFISGWEAHNSGIMSVDAAWRQHAVKND
jgi:hypothetical protein